MPKRTKWALISAILLMAVIALWPLLRRSHPRDSGSGDPLRSEIHGYCGTIVDETGGALVDAVVDLYGYGSSFTRADGELLSSRALENRQSLEFESSVRTDVGGHFCFSDSFLGRNPYLIRASKENYLAKSAVFSRLGGSSAPSIRLPKGGREISGRVLTPDGMPASDGQVWLIERDSIGEQRLCRALVDTTGRFHFTGAPNRPVLLTVRGKNGECLRWMDTGETRADAVVVSSSSLHAEVLDQAGKPVLNYGVALVHEESMYVERVEVVQSEKGTAEIDAIPPGSYRLLVWTFEGPSWRSGSLSFRPGAKETVRALIAQPMTAELVVSSTGGLPIANAELTFFPLPSQDPFVQIGEKLRLRRTGRTTPEGKGWIGLDEGPGVVEVSADGHAPVRTQVPANDGKASAVQLPQGEQYSIVAPEGQWSLLVKRKDKIVEKIFLSGGRRAHLPIKQPEWLTFVLVDSLHSSPYREYLFEEFVQRRSEVKLDVGNGTTGSNGLVVKIWDGQHPLPGALVQLASLDRKCVLSVVGKTNESGTLSVDLLPLGMYTVSARCGRHQDRAVPEIERQIFIDRDAVTQLSVPHARIRGSLTLAKGGGRIAGTVTAWRQGCLNPVAFAISTPQGNFTLDHLSEDKTYRLEAVSNSGLVTITDPVSLATASGEGTSDIILQPGVPISGVVEGASQENVMLYDESLSWAFRSKSTTLDAKGHFSMTNVSPGKYRLAVVEADRYKITEPFQVKASATPVISTRWQGELH